LSFGFFSHNFGRSKGYDYDEGDADGARPTWGWSNILMLPLALAMMLYISIVVPILMVAIVVWTALIAPLCSRAIARYKRMEPRGRVLVIVAGVAVLLLMAFVLLDWFPRDLPDGNLPQSTTPAIVEQSINILVDDFAPQPLQGDSIYYYNRLGGNRGAINDSVLDWGDGQVITTISSGSSWGGAWMSLNHPIRERLGINFSAILPPQVAPQYQSRITGLTAVIEDGMPGTTFKLELKDGGDLRWKEEVALTGGHQVVASDLPALGNIDELVWVLDDAAARDYVILESLSFTATTRITDTATAAFVWSYGMLLNNWNPDTGLVRDKAKEPSGQFDAIQVTGSLAAATASAEQLGVVSHTDAVHIVSVISDTMLTDVPRFRGLWPHWVSVSPTGVITIVYGTEWSSVDTVIGAVGLLDAQSGLGLDTAGTESMLRTIDWAGLVIPGGISHGYTYAGDPIPYAWDVFGGESWLVALAYAGATGQVAPIVYSTPPTANGSGFIDELAWLYVMPPSGTDYWETDWAQYPLSAANDQVLHYSVSDPTSCPAQLDLFGLSAAEVPEPSMVPNGDIYQAFGVGGRFASASDGTELLGAPVVVPHYSAMIAPYRPQEAIEMWDWLIDNGFLSPLNNVESLMLPVSSECDPSALVWNQLKGSWNLSLQTLGWGRYLAERNGQVPVLWQATTETPLLRKGYSLLMPDRSTSAEALPVLFAGHVPQPVETAPASMWNCTSVSAQAGDATYRYDAFVGGGEDETLYNSPVFDPCRFWVCIKSTREAHH
jgi:hypothetical protein